MTDFLPKNYKEPVESNYMSFEEGDNTFRVLGQATIGWEYWKEVVIEGKTVNRPVRVKKHDAIPLAEVVINKYGNLNLSFFWAFPVYNFDAKKIQILTVKQKTVRRGMKKYIKNPKWGDPINYSFVISRDQEEKPMYSVGVEPKEALDKKILKRFNGMSIDMTVWMNSDDPFKSNDDSNDDAEPIPEVDTTSNDEVPF